jgi:hypothetical protein
MMDKSQLNQNLDDRSKKRDPNAKRKPGADEGL